MEKQGSAIRESDQAQRKEVIQADRFVMLTPQEKNEVASRCAECGAKQ